MKRYTNNRPADAGLEKLEDRRLLSSTSFSGGVLTLTGDAALNNNFSVTVVGADRVMGYADNVGEVAPISQLQTVMIYTGNGADVVSVAANVTTPVEVIQPDGTESVIAPGTKKQFTPVATPVPTPAPVQSAPPTLGPVLLEPGPIPIPSPTLPVFIAQDPPTGSPTPVINVTDGATLYPGESVHVSALSSGFGDSDALHAQIIWNFGDPNGTYNSLPGFNAAHVYDTPGTYNVTLTITNPDGTNSTTSTQVTVLADNRTTIYVSPTGSDSNDGLSPNDPVQSIAQVNSLLKNNMRVLFEAGGTYDVAGSLNVNGLSNVFIGSYGAGASPILMYTGPETYGQIINLQPGTEGFTVQGMTFDSPYTNHLDGLAIPDAIRVNGSNITIRGNVFLDVEDAVDLGLGPSNVLVQDNTAPSMTALRAYFVWDSGNNDVILGNTVANSANEHVVRIGSGQDILIADNNFTNVTGKNAITIQAGQWAYVYNNVIPSGPVETGPLSTDQTGSLDHPEASFQDIVLEDNTFYDALTITPGSDDVMVRNNVFEKDGSVGIYIDAQESLFGRQVQNVWILNNTVIDSGAGAQWGGFLKIANGVAQNIVMDNNLFVDPNFIVGGGQAIVYVDDSSLESFSQIENNVWDVPQTYSSVNGGYFFMSPSDGDLSGYLTPAEWEATGVPTGDIYQNVTLSDSYSIQIGGNVYGANMPLAAAA